MNLNEGPKEDLNYREKAKEIYEAVEEALKEEKEDVLIQKNGEIVLPLRQINPRYGDIIFHFVEEGKRSGFTVQKDYHIIRIDVLKEKGNIKDIETRINGYKNVIIHELIHSFDKTRSGGKATDSKEVYDKNDKQAYYNNPDELNAYYQEGISELEDFLQFAQKDEHVYKAIKDKYASSFQEFYKWTIESFFNEEFIKHLTKKNRKRILKRMSKWYENQDLI